MKKMIKKYRKAKGFTLVELLIVIIIIGILAGMMMLSTGAATDRAEATKIISDMRNMKAAAMMYYTDYWQWPNENTPGADTSLDRYLDTTRNTNNSFVRVEHGNTSGDVFVVYQRTGMPTGIDEKMNTYVDNGIISRDNVGEYRMPVRRNTGD
ncbi:prepilin-type N-terminal cleavage/methylation domain-containing protein [Cloacibacillus porcorum]